MIVSSVDVPSGTTSSSTARGIFMAAWTWKDVALLPKRLWSRLFGAKIPEKCARIYFELVRSEFQSQQGLPDSRVDPVAEQAAQQIVAKYEASPDSLTMTDALLYERLICRLLPVASLRRKVMNLRGRFRRMVSPEDYQGYQDSSPPNPLAAPEADLVADLDDLLGRIEWVYVIAPFRELMRSRISIRVIFALIVLIGVVAVLVKLRPFPLLSAGAGVSPGAVLVPPLFMAVIMGAIGGLVSVEQRIQSAPSDGDAIRNVMALYDGMFSIYLSPVMGAVSAALLYALFVGGFLKGSLFPEFAIDLDGHSLIDLRTFIETSGPTDGTNYAKLMIWSFIGGFAERFVPDTLSRLVSTVEMPASGPPRPVVAPPTSEPAPPAHRDNAA
jgi:hypothetical protein